MKARPIIDQSRLQHAFQGAKYLRFIFSSFDLKGRYLFCEYWVVRREKKLIPTDGSVLNYWLMIKTR